MKFLKAITPFCVLGLALCVTTSSIYVTVKAAAQPTQVADEALTPAPIDEKAFEIAPPADPAFPALGDAEANVPPVPVPVAEVSIDDEILDPNEVLATRQHHIRLDANGGFTGRISGLTRPDGNLAPASGAKVRIVRDGNLVTSAMTNEDGTFTFTGLTEGVSAIIATGPDTLMLFAVRLVRENAAVADATPVSLEASEAEVVELEMNSAAVSGSDIAVARRLIFERLPEHDRRFQDATNQKEETAYPMGQGEPSTQLSHHQIQLRPDGSLVGEVNLLDTRTGRHREILDLTIHFVRDGEHVGSTSVQPSGEFIMPGLTPGVYSIVTNGSDGILALGVDLIGAFAGPLGDGKYKLTSIAQGLDLTVAPVNAENFNEGNASDVTDGELDPSSNSDDLPPPIVGGGIPGGGGFGPIGGPGGGGFAGGPGGGFGGGTGGGGGGFGGGGGGLGALLGAGVGAGLGYALADDNSTASPAR